MHSKIEPMKKMAKQIRNHKPLILNRFEAKGQFSSGIVEGFNNKAKLTMKRAYGFKSFHTIGIALYQALDNLSEPNTSNRVFEEANFFKSPRLPVRKLTWRFTLSTGEQ